MGTPRWIYLGYLLFLNLSVPFFSEARFPPPSGTAPDSGSGTGTGTGTGSGQGCGTGFSPGGIPPLFGIPGFGIHGKMPGFGSGGTQPGTGTGTGTGPLVCTPVNCPSPSGQCGLIYINLEPQPSSHGPQNKDNPHDEAAGHHQHMATAPSYY